MLQLTYYLIILVGTLLNSYFRLVMMRYIICILVI